MKILTDKQIDMLVYEAHRQGMDDVKRAFKDHCQNAIVVNSDYNLTQTTKANTIVFLGETTLSANIQTDNLVLIGRLDTKELLYKLKNKYTT